MRLLESVIERREEGFGPNSCLIYILGRADFRAHLDTSILLSDVIPKRAELGFSILLLHAIVILRDDISI